MASLVRISFGRCVANCTPKAVAGTQCRTITSKLDDLPPKPKPWNYHNKGYTLLNYFFDKTTARLDENSKLIVVEGPVAAGKSELAKELAKNFGMLYMPEANQDMIYTNSYGYDLKKLDSQLSEACRSWDVNNFLQNPKHLNSARFQIYQYTVKLSQYVDALAHIFSTGQGVVLDRCLYSDFVFLEAMFSQGFVSKQARKKYYEVRDNTISEILRPHLVIYLDVPVPTVLDNIKKRAIPWEKDSSVLNSKYLEVMEKNYKQNYLKEISNHAELLIYDWSAKGDVEIVVEDIERIDFNKYGEHDSKLSDWFIEAEEDYAICRHTFADKKQLIIEHAHIPSFEVPELVVDALEADNYHNVMNNAPGQEYEIGYNAAMGDKGIIFKVSPPHRHTLPLIERRV